ncbi:hypothetical protein PISMIDRAFT_16961 [Pisolithus microcarpus 441]|uniref:Uncharacterized protein n=1 Tax=Pisolithus microcarpus 441 TaxID=765257 RepID=A0A0C9YLY0_9AGAM|nr:hypothetical protein PISMIDRAFT_16961 [Pisolithus microcarpus 441]
MPPLKLPNNPLSKIGPPVRVRKSKRIKAATAKVQPSQDTQPHSKSGDSGTVADPPKAKPCPWCSLQGLSDKNLEEEYLNSFQRRLITLKSGKQINWLMALQQLCTSVITMKDIVDKDHDGQSTPSNMALDPCGSDTQQTDSEHDERVVEDAVQDTSEANASSHNTSSHPSATMHQLHERAGIDGPSMEYSKAKTAFFFMIQITSLW